MKNSLMVIKDDAVKVIAVLSVLLVLLSITLVYLAYSEFVSEGFLGDARIQVNVLSKENNEIVSMLEAREAEIVNLRAQAQTVKMTQNISPLEDDQGRVDMTARVRKAEADAKRAREAASVIQNELSHALEQAGNIEEKLKGRLALVEKERDEAQKLSSNVDSAGNVDTTVLKKELNSTLQQLKDANTELLALRRSVDRGKSRVPPNTRHPQAVPVKPLSSPPPVKPSQTSVFGQIKAVESADQFVVIQLNTTKGVLLGDALAVTRQGVPVGVLTVYRVGPQGVVFAVLTPDLREKVRTGDLVTLRK